MKIQTKHRQRPARRAKNIRRADIYQGIMLREMEVNLKHDTASRIIQAMWKRKRTKDPVRIAAEKVSANISSFEGLGALPTQFNTLHTHLNDSRPSTTSSTSTKKEDIFSPFTLRPLDGASQRARLLVILVLLPEELLISVK